MKKKPSGPGGKCSWELTKVQDARKEVTKCRAERAKLEKACDKAKLKLKTCGNPLSLKCNAARDAKDKACKAFNDKQTECLAAEGKLLKADADYTECMRSPPIIVFKGGTVKKRRKKKSLRERISAKGQQYPPGQILPSAIKAGTPTSPPGPIGIGAKMGDRGSYG